MANFEQWVYQAQPHTSTDSTGNDKEPVFHTLHGMLVRPLGQRLDPPAPDESSIFDKGSMAKALVFSSSEDDENGYFHKCFGIRTLVNDRAGAAPRRPDLPP